MKLSELKKHFQNKYAVRVIAGVLTIVVVAGSTGAVDVRAKNNTSSNRESIETTSTEDKASENDVDVEKIADEILGEVSVKDEDVDKEENVYFLSDANGNIEKTIVVDHLANRKNEKVLKDATNLTDIVNVKGKESFTQNGEELTWQADGNEIYYQGTADAKPPVSQKVTYFLDGKEMIPEEIAGKSGKVTIRFDYENLETYETTIGGEKQTVHVPFAAVTAMVLNDHFTNVEVTNAKIEKTGEQNVVVGYTLPGLQESLQIEEEDLRDDVTIPDYIEVTADVKEFELSTAMTFVVNASSYVSAGGYSTETLDETIDELTEATEQLQDGSGELADGADTLAEGIGTLDEKLGDFTKGMGELKDGLTEYTKGASEVADGTKTLDEGVSRLVNGADALGTGVSTLASSTKGINDGINTLDQTLAAGLTDSQKQMITNRTKQAVKDSFAGETASQVSQGIYAQLRYQVDGNNQVTGDGELYTTLYNGAVATQFKNNLDNVYAQVVNGVLAQAAGQNGTNEELASAIKGYYQAGANAYQTSLNALSQALQQPQTIERVVYETPVEESQETPAEESQETPVVETSVEETPVVEEQTGEMPVDQVEAMPVEMQAEEAPVMTEIPASEEQTEVIPSEETNDEEESPVEETTVAESQNATSESEAPQQTSVVVVERVAQNALDQSMLAGLSEQNAQAFVVYNAIKDMNPQQLAEFLYAQGHTTTLLQITEAKLNENIAAASGQITSGVESALTTLAGKLTSACGTVAEQVASQAALTSAAGTMQTIRSSINATQANGYSLVSGSSALYNGVKELDGKVPELTNGIMTLKDGTGKLSSGAATLVSNNDALLSGIGKLQDGTNQVVDGVSKLADGSNELADGAHELADGVVEFNEEGINKLIDAYDGDMIPMLDRLQAVIDAGEEYQTYSTLAKGQTGNVKFIYKLASVKAEEKNE